MLALIVIFDLLTSSNAVTFSLVVPDGSISGPLGSSVVLPCTLSPSLDCKQYKISWYRPDNNDIQVLLYEDLKVKENAGDPQYRGRASLVGDLQKGNVSLKLENLTAADRGEYVCYVHAYKWYEMASVFTSVTVIGSAPYLSLAEVGDQVNVTCASDGWSPKPSLIWRDMRGKDLKNISEYNLKDSEGLVSVRSWLMFSPSDSEWISCSVGLSDQEIKEGRVFPLKILQSGWKAAFLVLLVISVLVISLLICLMIRVWQKPSKYSNTDKEARPLIGKISPPPCAVCTERELNRADEGTKSSGEINLPPCAVCTEEELNKAERRTTSGPEAADKKTSTDKEIQGSEPREEDPADLEPHKEGPGSAPCDKGPVHPEPHKEGPANSATPEEHPDSASGAVATGTGKERQAGSASGAVATGTGSASGAVAKGTDSASGAVATGTDSASGAVAKGTDSASGAVATGTDSASGDDASRTGEERQADSASGDDASRTDSASGAVATGTGEERQADLASGAVATGTDSASGDDASRTDSAPGAADPRTADSASGAVATGTADSASGAADPRTDSAPGAVAPGTGEETQGSASGDKGPGTGGETQDSNKDNTKRTKEKEKPGNSSSSSASPLTNLSQTQEDSHKNNPKKNKAEEKIEWKKMQEHKVSIQPESETDLGVLFKERIRAGQYYWEVNGLPGPSKSSASFRTYQQNKSPASWYVGVISETVMKNQLQLSPQNCWVLHYDEEKGFYVNDSSLIPVPVKDRMYSLGVFIDCKKHTLSFYNCYKRSRLYTFYNVDCTQPLVPVVFPGLKPQCSLNISTYGCVKCDELY